ncbi:MAG: glycosyltransferase [Patescibacteria group bacterium]
MKVLMISTDRKIFEDGRGARSRMIEYGALVRELHIVVFVAKEIKNKNWKLEIANNVWAYPTNSKSKWHYVGDAIRLGKQIIRGNHSLETERWLVTAQDPSATGLVAWRIAQTLKLPFQLQVHTDIFSPHFVEHSVFNKLLVRIARFLLPRAAGVRVVSERIRRALVAKYRLPSTKVSVLPIFVNVREIEKAEPKVNLHVLYPQFNFIILMASRLEREKNIPLALLAFKDIIRTHPRVGLVILGDGSEKHMLGQIVSNNGLHGNVVFAGWSDDIVSYYKTADLFLLTSDYEGYGMTLIEAAAAGCPIVTTDVGAVGEIITKDNALVCPVGDKECLAKQIRLAIENKGMRERLARNAREAVLRVAPGTKEQYLEQYKKCWEQYFS